jgi:hypothetical protein
MAEKNEKPAQNKNAVKVVQLIVGLDLIGSKVSMNFRESEMEAMPFGVIATSKKNGRRILIPWANIKGCELFGDQPEKKGQLPAGAVIGEIPPKNRV